MNAPVSLSVRRCVAWSRRAIDRFHFDTAALRADRAGNVAIIFALSLVPVFGAVGAAVDYSRANSARTAMQVALDTTALMISKEALDLKSGQVQKKAKSYFNAQFNRPDVKKLKVTFTMQNNGPGDFTVIAQATGTIDTAIAQVIGKKTIDLRTDTQVRWGFKSLEIALALDNTGSMAAKNKMVELKAAVKLLLATMKKNSKVPDDTKIAIIPFSTVVNVGTGFVDAPWIAYDAKITKANWTGCVADRDQPNDVKDTPPTGGAATLFPVADCGSLAKALAADQRLGRDGRRGRRHDAVGHDQRDHRHDVGLARADAERTVHAGAGGEERRRKSADPFDRRPQHAEPLHHQPDPDRQAYRRCLRQPQEREDPRFHRPCDRGKCPAAAGLRQRAQHVLRRAGGKPAHARVRLDRRKPVRRAARESSADHAPDAPTNCLRETRRGGVAPMFALAAIPLVGAIGRAQSTTAALQAFEPSCSPPPDAASVGSVRKSSAALAAAANMRPTGRSRRAPRKRPSIFNAAAYRQRKGFTLIQRHGRRSRRTARRDLEGRVHRQVPTIFMGISRHQRRCRSKAARRRRTPCRSTSISTCCSTTPRRWASARPRPTSTRWSPTRRTSALSPATTCRISNNYYNLAKTARRQHAHRRAAHGDPAS